MYVCVHEIKLSLGTSVLNCTVCTVILHIRLDPSYKIKEFYSIIDWMTKVMHLDNVFEVFIFLFFIFGYFFCARRGAF